MDSIVLVVPRVATSTATPPPIASAMITAAATSHGPLPDLLSGGGGAGPDGGPEAPPGLGIARVARGSVAAAIWLIVGAGTAPLADGPPGHATTAHPPLSAQQSA
jgi:hypothetical protein